MENKLRIMTPTYAYTKDQHIKYIKEIRALLKGMTKDSSTLELQICKNKIEEFVKANVKKH